MAEERFFVTKDSQELSDTLSSREYVGMRDLSDLERLGEETITAEDGAIVGVKNRVRAGLATFENPDMLKRVRNSIYTSTNVTAIYVFVAALY